MESFLAGVEQVAEELALPTPMPPASLIGMESLVEPGVLVEVEATAVLDWGSAPERTSPDANCRESHRRLIDGSHHTDDIPAPRADQVRGASVPPSPRPAHAQRGTSPAIVTAVLDRMDDVTVAPGPDDDDRGGREMRRAVTVLGFIALILAFLAGLTALWWSGIPWWQSMLSAFVLLGVGALCLGTDTHD